MEMYWYTWSIKCIDEKGHTHKVYYIHSNGIIAGENDNIKQYIHNTIIDPCESTTKWVHHIIG